MKKPINNFCAQAYNTIVEKITITQSGFNEGYIAYLQDKVQERFSFLPATCNLRKEKEDSALEFQTETAYCPYVRKFAEDNIADIIAIGYKYAFLDKNIRS